ncbi:MAG: hypothetical protein A3K76_05405 [Euryarchaeota archaeon RBG_13_57_23]|nr:MAG: hypothetical protein A3K76_05405 [Euryarchaeota archaeon RBG_13_57_23]
MCAKDLDGKESRCPRCGIPLVSKAEMLECPECGALAPQDSKSCPRCGIGFEEGELEPPTRPKPPVPLPVKGPEPEGIAVVSSIEPPPKTEGLVNGRGAKGGSGFVNGTGLVNGTGMTNGTRFDAIGPSGAKRQGSFITRWQFLAVLVVVIMIVSAFVYLSYVTDDGSISVDGNFGDWSDTQKFTSYTTSTSTTVNVEEWAVRHVGFDLYLYVKVEGAVMWTSEVSSLYLFIDSDDSQSTGYSIAGIGADYLVELVGWDGEVGASALYRYGVTDSEADRLDWNKWSYLSGANAAINDDRLEAVVELPIELGPDAKYLLVSQDASTHLSASYPVPESGGILVITQEPGPAISAAGTVSASSSLAFMSLTLACDGTGGTVDSITPTVAGGVPGAPMLGVSIALGSKKTVTIAVDTSSSSAGVVVSAFIRPSDVVSNFDEVIVLGTPVSAYVSAAPSTIQIDGAFGDWYGLTSLDGDTIPLANPNTDIERVGAVNESTQSFFYVSVLGEICSGTYVPVIAAKPASGGGGGGTVVLPRKGGEDILRIYIDTDPSMSTGYMISASAKTIGADFRVEVKGMFGQIVSEVVSSYSAGSWVAVSGADMDADNDLNEMEVRVSAASISGASAIDFVVETTDWNARKDVATAFPSGSRAVQTMVNMISPESWIIDGGTNAQATAMSYQRKLFYDGTNIWSFYWDGSNTVYKYSMDGGQTWSSGVRAFSTAAVNEVSIWYDSANSAVYAIGDSGSATRNVYVQKGTVSPSTHAITWQPSDSSIIVSSQSIGGKNSFISLDASGYVWLLSSNLTSVAPDTYGLTAWISSAAGSTSSFLVSGSMISGGVNNQPNIKGSLVPTGSGSDVWAVYMYSGSVYSRKYTGSWSAQTAIFTNTEDIQNQDLAPAVAVVDGAGVIHVVYGNGHQQPAGTCKPYIYYVYNTGSAWSVPYRLDSAGNQDGNFYPTISLDTSTGSIYAFWVYWDSPGAGYTIIGRKNVSGTWTTLTLPAQTTNVKQYLTSIYSAPAENFVCWQWTQNTTAPIELHFEKLPEFGSVVLPAFFIMIVCIASIGLHRKRR